jgi:tetratricopeptide (TPR) repeat protein
MSAKGYHWTNLILHLANVVLVFRLANLLTKNYVITLMTALLFAIHPMRVEAVAWVSARTELLSSFFLLLSLLQYAQYTLSKSISKITLSFVLFLLAFLSKPVVIAFPLVFFLVDYWQERKFSVAVLAEKLPFLLLSTVLGVLMLTSSTPDNVWGDFSLLNKITLSFTAITFYLLAPFAPVDANLSVAHTLPKVVNGLLPMSYYLSILFVFVLVVLILSVKKIRKDLLFAVGFVFINVIVVATILPYGQFVIADRHAYFAHLGWFMLIASAGVGLGNLTNKQVIYGILGIFALFCAVQTFKRNQVWKESITVWIDVVSKNPEYAYGFFGLGNSQHERKDYERAIECFNRAIFLEPKFTRAYYNRGVSFYAAGNFQAASKDFFKTLQEDMNNADAWLQTANSFYMMKDYNKAINAYGQVIRMKPNYYPAYLYRGHSKFAIEDKEGACYDFDVVRKAGLPDGERLWKEAGCQ